MDQEEQNITISLQELQKMHHNNDKKQEQKEQNFFPAYEIKNDSVIIVPLITIDTKKFPRIPIRRLSCTKLQCMYEYDQWKKNKQYEIYKQCRCKTGVNENKDFEIDWRLTSLLQKLTNIDEQTYKYDLYFIYGHLWIMKLNLKSQILQKSEIYYEDIFGNIDYNQVSQLQPKKVTLNDSNIRYFKNLLKLNVQEHLQNKNDWQTSNLQEQCHEIVDKIISLDSIQKIKSNLLLSASFNQYANMPSLKYAGNYHDNLITEKKNLKSDDLYNGCSNNSNEHIMFYYCDQTKLIYIRNAQYFQGDGYANIRAIPIIDQQNEMDRSSRKQGVWFKDRKGDIFCIQRRSLYIYKFHLFYKSYKQFKLILDAKLGIIDNPSSLIYIPQKDAVFYFNAPDFKQSFYFQLYRSKEIYDKAQKKEEKAEKKASIKLSLNSCVSINIRHKIFQDKQAIRTSSHCKVAYAIQKYKFPQKKGAQRQQLTPIIYLLVERQNNIPIKLGLYKFVFHPQFKKIYELTSQGQTVNKDSNKDKIKFQSGIFGIHKNGQATKLYIQTLLNHQGIIYEGKIFQNLKKGQRRVFWTQKLNEITAKKEIEAQKPKNIKQIEKKEILNYKIYSLPILPNQILSKTILNSPQPILINDIAGLNLNNEIRLLGYLVKERRIVELSLNNFQGGAEWSIYHFV